MRIEKSKMPGLYRCCPVSAERVRHAVLGALLAVLAGCGTNRPAPVSERLPPSKTAAKPVPAPARAAQVEAQRPDSYTVKAGDTLYSIALEFGFDYRELAAWNSIDPSRIRVGQTLRLTPPGVVTTPLQSAPGTVESQALGTAPGRTGAGAARSEPRGVRMPYSDQGYAQLSGTRPETATTPQAAAKPEVARADDDMDWIWPVSGKVITAFNDSSSKGIAIAGKLGQPVVAAAPGRVIFSGTGIRGLGKLIVIKHNEKFLSVYAHNRDLMVKEGQAVTRGQKIAEMGNTDTDQVQLHFEIRRLGKPVDPASLLPPA